MKKLITFLMGILLIFTLVACSNQRSVNNNNGNNNTGNNNTVNNNRGSASVSDNSAVDDSKTGNKAQGGKTLVVYYSASGNTKAVAGYIAAATGADTFELVPVKPYSNADLNWTDNSSRVVYEHNNTDARNVELIATTVDDWSSYDTIFIGYPIWWGIAAWPVNGFIEANDFTGKTVIPFCTAASSGIGQSGKLLEEATGTGNWLEGQRFASRPTEATVRTWVEGLGL